MLKNVDALMRYHWGKINKTRFATEAGAGQGTYDRIEEGTSIGLDLLEKIAAVFKLQAWQLIAAELDPAAPAQTHAPWPFELFTPDEYTLIPMDYRKRVENELAGEVLRAKKKRNGTNDL